MQEQEQTVQNIYGRMVAVLHGCESAQMDLAEFRAALQRAASADILGVWPFKVGLGCTDAYNIRVRVYTGVHTCPR